MREPGLYWVRFKCSRSLTVAEWHVYDFNDEIVGAWNIIGDERDWDDSDGITVVLGPLDQPITPEKDWEET